MLLFEMEATAWELRYWSWCHVVLGFSVRRYNLTIENLKLMNIELKLFFSSFVPHKLLIWINCLWLGLDSYLRIWDVKSRQLLSAVSYYLYCYFLRTRGQFRRQLHFWATASFRNEWLYTAPFALQNLVNCNILYWNSNITFSLCWFNS